MGAKALQMQAAPDAAAPTQLVQSAPPAGPVQRKVGFEIEIVGLSVVEPGDDLDDEEEKESYIGLGGESISSLSTPKQSSASTRKLRKGEVLHQGTGWKLTPDGSEGHRFVPEYIVRAVDETTALDTLLAAVASAAAHAEGDLHDPTTWSKGDDLTVEENRDDVFGSFHVTAAYA